MPLPRPGPTTALDAPGFELDLVLDAYADQIEANGSAIAAHATAADPHPVYTTVVELAAAITGHESLSDPHPNYTTAAEVAALAPAETATTIGNLITGATLKTLIADLDTFAYVDSIGGQVVKISYADLKAAIGSTGGSGAVASTGITDATAAGRAMLTAVDSVAQRSLLGLGTAALAATSAFANSTHGHVPGDVVGLGTAATYSASAFATASHSHPASGISDATAAGRTLLTAADATAQRTALGLGTAATTATTDYATASHSHASTALTDATAAGRALLTAADASAQRTALALGTAATTSASAYATVSHAHATTDITGFAAAALSAAPAETAATLGNLIAGASAKPTPSGTDLLLLSDGSASNVGKKISISELQTAIGGGGGGSFDAKAAGLPIPVFSVGVPFVLFAGNGSTAGMQFTGSAGAFTLTAAIITNGYLFLSGGYAYLPANFGGQTIAAGWYWFTMSSDTAGVLYQETYTSGQPVRPASPTPFAVNLSGWLTQTNSEVTGPNGFTLPANALGNNGYLEHMLSVMATSSGGTKTGRVKAGGSTVANYISGGSNYQDVILFTRNQGTPSKQKNSRANGVDAGASGMAVAGVEATSVDLSTSKSMVVTMQNSAIGESFALLAIACRSTFVN